MIRRAFAILLLLAAVVKALAAEAPQQHWTLEAANGLGWAVYDPDTGLFHGTNGVIFTYDGAYVTADSMTVKQDTDQVFADGNVRIQQREQLWIGEHIVYNWVTGQLEAREFRTGKPPVFVEGQGLHAESTDTNKMVFSPGNVSDQTNLLLRATNAFINIDDISDPLVKIRARSITVIPGQKLIARHAFLEVGGVPIFYWAYYERNLGPQANNFNFHPGYRSSYGAFLLTRYQWFLNQELDGILHTDYRTRRGPGVGPDVNLHMGKWGEAFIRYYYLDDFDPYAGISITNGSPWSGNTNNPRLHIPHDRQRLAFEWVANPYTNLSFRSQINYQTDPGVLHDFLEVEYRHNPQPPTFLEANKVSQNFSLDLYAHPRLNEFLETVERLPDVRLTGYRQQLWETPLYYESQSSIGYFRRRFADTNQLYPIFGAYSTNGQTYAAARADTYHEITLPETFFGWLNFTPRVGGRFTYYSSAEGPGAVTEDASRAVFDTGAELSFKASRVWPGFQSKLFEADGLRHIIEPSVDYAYVPRPNKVGTNEIPQFDFELPSLRLLPLEFPEYNSIDTIDEQNTLRLGMRNKLQTKRAGKVVDLVDWDLYADWHLHPEPLLEDGIGRQDQGHTFSDVYSDLVLRPRSWLTFESLTRFDSVHGDLRFSMHTVTLQPSTTWNWTIAHFYLRHLSDDPTNSPIYLGDTENIVSSSFFFNLNENWSARLTHRIDVAAGRMQEQIYTVYRDFRSWTGALSFRWRDNPSGPQDFGVAFTFSIKAYPRYPLGVDAVRPYYLLGGG